MILSPKEKLLLFSHRRRKTMKQIAQELSVSPEYLSAVINGKYQLSDRLTNEIELLFRREGFTVALDDELNL
jgi:transcriptional regulator with XRE-family HTH domain